MTNIKDDSYIVVFGWMRSKLHLDGADLLVYAAIYGFSQDGVNEYTATVGWLAEMIGVDRRTVSRSISKLLEKGYVVCFNRNQYNGSTNTYKVIALEKLDLEGGATKCPTPMTKCPTPMTKCPTPMTKCPTPYDKMSHPFNIINNLENKGKVIEKNERKKELKENSIDSTQECAGVIDLTSLSDEELQAWRKSLCELDFNEDTLSKIQAYDDEIKRRKSSGWKGKMVRHADGRVKSLKSFDDIISSYGFEQDVEDKIYTFIQHCRAGGRVVSNAKLTDLCVRLSSIDGEDSMDKSFKQIEAIMRAIRRGCYDIKVKVYGE